MQRRLRGRCGPRPPPPHGSESASPDPSPRLPLVVLADHAAEHNVGGELLVRQRLVRVRVRVRVRDRVS